MSSDKKENKTMNEDKHADMRSSSKNYEEKHLSTEAGDGKKKGSWTGRIILAVLLVIALAAYFAVPAVHEWINNVLNMFRTGNFDDMREFIAQYGKWAMAISFFLMVFQSIAAPLPAFFITLTNANLFGWWQGCILSWASSMAGAALCFWIARILGRDVVERICTKGALLSIEEFFAKYGKRCILVARLLPFISFDIVSYAAGLTAMDFGGFFLATGLGQLPACVVYSYVGGMLTGGAKKMFIGLMCLFALAIVVILIKQVYNASQKKQQEAAEAAGEVFFREPSNPARFFSKFYNSALWAMTAALFCSGIPAIAKINIGWVFFGLWLGLFAISLLFKRFKCGVVFTLISTVISLAVTVYLCGSAGALGRKPAGIVRMGLGLRTVPFRTFNIIFTAFIVVGLITIVLLWKRQKGIDQAAHEEYEKLKAEKRVTGTVEQPADAEVSTL